MESDTYLPSSLPGNIATLRAKNDISGFVLAGGHSQRMGRDKAQLDWWDGTLLTHAVSRLRQVAHSVAVVAGPSNSSGDWERVADTVPECGPLAGIHAALAHTTTEWNVVLAVDVPLATTGLLQFLLERSDDQRYIAVVPSIAGRLEPLCAVYKRSLLPEFDRALRSYKLSVHRLLEVQNTRMIDEEELIGNGFSPKMLLNVNTPEDLEQARRLAATLYV